MATAESAVSRRHGFEETAKKIKDKWRHNINSLTKVMEEVREVYYGFYEEYLPKIPCEPEKIKQLHDNLMQTEVELKEELKKAVSEDVAIVFVGCTSSGKSSVINALLRDSRLPVDKIQTTMCRIQVRLTADEEWSVVRIGCEEPLPDMNQKALKALLSKMSGESEREKLGIDSRSVIQVNWPRRLCSLPENIILIDTPGFKEDNYGDKVVFDSCKEAEILVAVMDLMSPSIKNNTNLLNKVKCQLKFGVFTKWDEDLQEEEKGTTEKRKQIRDYDEKEFQKLVNDKCSVYFVDAKHFTKAEESPQGIEGRENFSRFERDLAQSAKSVKARKGVVLIEHAEAAISEQEKTLKNVQNTLMETRKSRKDRLNAIDNTINRLEQEQRSLDAVIHEAKKLNDLINRYLDEEKIDRLVEELDNNIRSCNTVESEDIAIDKFFKEKIGRINKELKEQTLKIVEEFEKRMNDFQSVHALYCNESMPSCEDGEPKTGKDSKYRWFKDPYGWFTNSKFWSAVLGFLVAIGAATACVASGFAGLIAAMLPETATALVVAAAEKAAVGLLGSLGFGSTVAFSTLVEILTGSGVAQKIRSLCGPSEMKVDKITQFARGLLIEIKEHFEKCAKPVLERFQKISDEVSSEIKENQDLSREEKPKLITELKQLKHWLKKLAESTESLQEVRKEFGKLKLGPKGKCKCQLCSTERKREKDSVPLDDQTENQSTRRLRTLIKKEKF